ncbi:Cation efflux family protein [compost metagenome]
MKTAYLQSIGPRSLTMSLHTTTSNEHRKRLAWGLGLVIATMAYNTVEAVLALWTGVQDRSVSLEAFGLDSIIEWALGAVLVWRLTVEARGTEGERLEAIERKANWAAGIVFYLLAAFIVLSSGYTLLTRSESEPSLIGIGLAIASVLIMPVVAIAKTRIGDAIGSSALKAEASCTWVCAYMSATLLVGLVATRYLGWWWADPVAALGILYWVVQEGRESFERAAGRDTCCGCSGGD